MKTDVRPRAELLTSSDAEILLTSNAELQGLANSYALAQSVRRYMNKLAYVWQTSFFKTLAHKHKTSVTKIARRLKTETGYAITVPGKQKTRVLQLFSLKELKPPQPGNAQLDRQPNTLALTLDHSELIRRLNAGQCETEQGPFEVHVRRFGGRDRAHLMVRELMEGSLYTPLTLPSKEEGDHSMWGRPSREKSPIS